MISDSRKKAKVFFEVSCGNVRGRNRDKRINVSGPKNDREKKEQGCPQCGPHCPQWKYHPSNPDS